MLNKIEEELLTIIKSKYEETDKSSYDVCVFGNEFPDYITPNLENLSEILKSAGYISYVSIDDYFNTIYTITPFLSTYFDDKEKMEVNKERSSGATYNISTVNADGSNFTLGDVINSQISIDNSKDKSTKREGSDKNESQKKLDISLGRIVAIFTIIGVIGGIIFGILQLID